MTDAAPLGLWRETIRPEWIDYNGHIKIVQITLMNSIA